MWVVTHQLSFDHHTRQPMAINGQASPLLFRQAQAQWHRIIRTAAVEFFAKNFEISLGNRQQCLKFSNGGLQILHAFTYHREDVGGPVVCQQFTVAVIDQPPLGR